VREWEENIPSEKKSTAGAADTLGAGRGGAVPPSTEILDRPFFKEGGIKDTELVLEFVCSESPFVVELKSWSASVAGPFGSSSATAIDPGAAGGLDILNTNPGPFPPPSTRSGGAVTGTFCLGAGSIESNKDLPAPTPESNLGLFAAGLSSSSLSSESPGSVGSPIVIFFGPRFDFGGGRDSPLPELGGGRDIKDFFGIVCLDVEGVNSLPLSLSLP
jgi:hypothetical protein